MEDAQRKRKLTCIGVTILCSSLYVEFLPGESSSFPCKQFFVHQAAQAMTKRDTFWQLACASLGGPVQQMQSSEKNTWTTPIVIVTLVYTLQLVMS